MGVPLTEEQNAELLRMTTECLPAADINKWLVGDCQVSFPEASALRRAAVGTCGLDPAEYLSRSRFNATQRKKERRKRKSKPTALQEVAYNVNLPMLKIEHEEEVPSCITCKSKTFECECRVKVVADIPF